MTKTEASESITVTLKAKGKMLPDGYLLFDDAVLAYARITMGKDWPGPDHASLLPCYLKTVKEGTLKKKVFATHYFEATNFDSRVTYQNYWDDVVVPETLTSSPKKVLESISLYRKEMVKNVLNGKLVGRLDLPNQGYLPLDNKLGIVFRDNQIDVYCSSFLLVNNNGGMPVAALLSFEQKQISELKPPGYKRPWANQSARSLTQDECQAMLKQVELIIATHRDSKFADKKIVFTRPDLASLLMELCNIPSNEEQARPGEFVALSTLEEFVKLHANSAGSSIKKIVHPEAGGAPNKKVARTTSEFLYVLRKII
jgi:hypothetical protein